jgi:hypothetical protein
MNTLSKCLITWALVATACGAAVPTLVQRGRLGPVKTKMSHADLEKITGSADIVDGTYKSEDSSRPCTDLWPNQPAKHIRVLWDSSQRVELGILDGPISEYHTGDGITLGTTLRQLEKLNGKPFKITGFGGIYGGHIRDWNDGKLQDKLNGLSFVLEVDPLRWTHLPDEGEAVSGERSLLSSEPELHRLDPHVGRIEVDLTPR